MDSERPHPGATQGQIRTQFLGESTLLALVGGALGIVADAAATVVYDHAGLGRRDPRGVGGRHRSGHLIGAGGGLTPAIRVSRLPPTVALRTA
jgi:putative ABC transport system permease protein